MVMAHRTVSVFILVFLLTGAFTATAVGADPSPAAIEPLLGGDLRSDGSGPGIVGSPLMILGAVVVLGAATVVVTAIVARLSQRP
jgi:hypothetical protein